MNAGQPLKGLNVLLVEDETLVSFVLEDMLQELGAAVWHAANVAAALELLKTQRPAIAILDLNLGGEQAYPVAEQLARDAIPFVFVSGYGREGLQPRWATRPTLSKPVLLPDLEKAIAGCLA